MTPALERLMAAVEGRTGHKRERSGDGFKLWCPVHGGHSAALKVDQAPDGSPLIHCHGGCDSADVLAAVGWKWADLHESTGPAPHSARYGAPGRAKAADPIPSPSPQSFAQFCEARRLDPVRLAGRWQVTETSHKGRPGLRYPTSIKVDRVKYLDGSKPKNEWAAKGGRKHLYGLGAAKGHGGPVLYLVNGEPSVWACDQEGVPAVCLCGEKAAPEAAHCEALRAAGWARVAVVYDRDAAGRAGALKAVQCLRNCGLEAVALELPADLGDHADVDDLHRREGANLGAALAVLPELAAVGNDCNLKKEAAPILRPFSEIEREEVSWLWEPYIPKGKLVLFQGDPGSGKTWAALAVCAQLTRQGLTAIYATLEDGWADTLKPRAEKVGCDVARLVALMGRRGEDGEEYGLTLADVPTIEAALLEVKPALLVLDPISAWLGGGTDMNKANEVRGRLTPMVRLAERHGVTMLVLQHLTKARTDRAIYRGQGSVDFGAAARSILIFGETQAKQRAMVHEKNSLGPKGKAIGYCIGPEGFRWGAELDITAADLFEPEADPAERGQAEDARAWLEDQLSKGPQEAGPLIARGEKAGHCRRTLQRERVNLGAVNRKDGFSGGWVWALPEGANESPEGARHTNLGAFEQSTASKAFEGGRSTEGAKEIVPGTLAGEAGAFEAERWGEV